MSSKNSEAADPVPPASANMPATTQQAADTVPPTADTVLAASVNTPPTTQQIVDTVPTTSANMPPATEQAADTVPTVSADKPLTTEQAAYPVSPVSVHIPAITATVPDTSFEAPAPLPVSNLKTKEESTNNFRRTVLICLAVFVSAISAMLISIYLKPSTAEECDMKKAENRDFNKYYGIVNMKNHFTTPNADDCTSNIIFKPALPQAILQQDHSASSFLTLAPYGTGKTLLRCEYYKSLRSDAYFKVLILNKEIDGYLDRASKAEIQIKERLLYRDKPLLTYLENDLRKLGALRQDGEKLHLLLAIAEGEGFQTKTLETTRSINVLNDLRHFALFMKNRVKKTVAFVIDGIDENRFYFERNNVNKQSLELFYSSSIDQQIILETVAENFYLSIFYPKIDGINIEDASVTSGNLVVHTIKWDTKLLIDYADYVLQEMNKHVSASRCKSFTDFKTLVNYSNTKNAEIINKITTPRTLHYFMRYLITEMNECADDIQKPFIATAENVRTAYERSTKSAFKVHYIRV
ncbi:unnamed protein product [Adineta steineri]|uniref:Uncharacterized protein n=1 Tax=Adineta steineri TaxID=433720 RepID=A0A814U9X1_9BILA|nr:unnamed protein product [Adineta steineri]CAF1315202.1 unnamed protein product [Adineta steineri]